MAPAAPKPPAIFKAPLPPLPVAPPPTPALAPLPPSVAPVNKPASTLTAPVLASAAGTGTAFPGGMRITFGNGQGELSPASEQSLKTLVRQAPPSETVSYNVLAYAPGTPEDPSTARRLSLARGLAVRSVLMSVGVASARIYVRALGAPVGAAAGSATPDRVDVSLLGTNAPPDPPRADPPRADPPTSSPAAPETGAARTP